MERVDESWGCDHYPAQITDVQNNTSEIEIYEKDENIPLFKKEPGRNESVDQSSHFENVPDYLKSLEQWVLWKFEARFGQKAKVPYQTNGLRAKSNDLKTWNSFVECLDVLTSGAFDGLGFMLKEGDNLVAIDLDHCIDSSGSVVAEAQEILRMNSTTYVERSPSKDGLHIWCFGKAITTGKKQIEVASRDMKLGLEVYDYTSPRYLTITGDIFQKADLQNNQASLDWLYEKYFADSFAASKEFLLAAGDLDRQKLSSALERIPPDDYATWIQVGMALKTANLNLEVWEEWSRRSNKFGEGICAEKWRTFSGSGVGLGTIFHLARTDSSDAVEIDWASESNFGEVIPFEDPSNLELGSDFLPSWLKLFVDELAASTQTSGSMASIQALSILAACLQQKFCVSPQLDDDYSEPLSLWTVIAMEPGSRKSAVLEALRKPVSDWEFEEQNRLKDEIQRTNMRRDLDLRRIEELKKQASRGDL